MGTLRARNDGRFDGIHKTTYHILRNVKVDVAVIMVFLKGEEVSINQTQCKVVIIVKNINPMLAKWIIQKQYIR